jgi:hypothetical protein
VVGLGRFSYALELSFRLVSGGVEFQAGHSLWILSCDHFVALTAFFSCSAVGFADFLAVFRTASQNPGATTPHKLPYPRLKSTDKQLGPFDAQGIRLERNPPG